MTPERKHRYLLHRRWEVAHTDQNGKVWYTQPMLHDIPLSLEEAWKEEARTFPYPQYAEDMLSLREAVAEDHGLHPKHVERLLLHLLERS